MPTSMLLRKFPSSSVGLVGNDDEKGTPYLSSLISSSTKHKDRHKSPLLVVVVVTTSNYFKHYYYSLCRHCHCHCHCFLLLLSFFLLLLFSSMWFFSASATNHLPIINNNKTTINNCTSDVSVYVYELPAKFNRGLLHNCRHLNIYTDMCPHVANRGLGQPISMLQLGGASSWYATHQFIAEMIFHARLQNHPCRTRVPGDNTLFYIPFYGGLHASSKFREANLTERDLLGVELVDYVSQQRWWKRKQGRDHLLVLGRTAWDFMRTDDHDHDFGANNLLNLPGVKNMSVLTVERHPWQGHNQFGIPYPSYLHPMSSNEVEAWQAKMRDRKRPHLFSFVGAPRRGVEKASIRDEIIRQCSGSSQESCYLLECGRTMSRCHDASQVLGVMTRSQFCLQAPGDSFTRRSTFDSVLAGCIPVFFSVHTAYSQYGWYLPKDAGEYSVYIPADAGNNIEERLKSIPSEEVERMRNTVIGLIPRLTYMHPNATATTNNFNNFKDAVDVALEQLSRFVNSNSSILQL